jgi:hypothetical protein
MKVIKFSLFFSFLGGFEQHLYQYEGKIFRKEEFKNFSVYNC